jgi:hypothetical protein
MQFEITAGKNSDGDPAGRLLPLAHETRKLVGRANEKPARLQPGANWSEVAGRQFYFEDLPTGSKRDDAFVFVWLCDEAAVQATVAQGNVELRSEYAGKIGRWQVYVGPDVPARQRWPNAVEEIKKALAADQP